MGTSVASEPINLSMTSYSFILSFPLEMVALNTYQIYLMIYLIDIQILTKYAIELANNLNKLIDCEAQLGANKTIIANISSN